MPSRRIRSLVHLLEEVRIPISEQAQSMREKYPGFCLEPGAPWILVWHGKLRPLAQTYGIQIIYSAVTLGFAGIQSYTPHVEIIAPLLRPRSTAGDVAIPHVYPNTNAPHRPRLCLYRDDEWTPAQHLAETIIPWTIEWLIGYEGWRATGKWLAGGHGTERRR